MESSVFLQDLQIWIMHELELQAVDAGYNWKTVIHQVSFKMQEPAIYIVLGPNGVGKTTLFRTIAGILKPISGKVMFDGKSIFESKEIRSSINYLSHFNALPEEMTVAQALKFYADLEGGDPKRVLEELNLQELSSMKISDLSQGQKKRVSIAKVFLRDRGIYLLDEPTSNLDPIFSKELREFLLRLSKDKFVLYSSHNLYEARDVGTYLILLKEGTVRFFDRISNIKTREYRVGIKATSDISGFVSARLDESGYYEVTVKSPVEAGQILKQLVEKGILVTEMRQLDNPLEELFEVA
jgi:ABC-2 type transport system ATP-binding protein